MLEHLRLSDTWVTHQQYIDVTSDFHAINHLLSDTANHQQKERLLDLVHAEYLRADRAGKAGVELHLVFGGVLQVLHFFLSLFC